MGSTTPTIENRKARHDYEIVETLEAGIALTGTEVKSAREGRVNMRDSYVSFSDGQAIILGLSISPYENKGYTEHHANRPKKLLLHKREIDRWARKAFEKNMTVIPLKFYFSKRNFAKVLIALAVGKRQYDKRRSIQERQVKRDLDRAKKEANN